MTTPNCLRCGYYFYDTGGYAGGTSTIILYPSVAKHINEFTADELLAEIKRRMGT
jgi:hypothetical protein